MGVNITSGVKNNNGVAYILTEEDKILMKSFSSLTSKESFKFYFLFKKMLLQLIFL